MPISKLSAIADKINAILLHMTISLTRVTFTPTKIPFSVQSVNCAYDTQIVLVATGKETQRGHI